MESILLAAIDKDDRRGELSFRFSMNYSTMFDKPEQKLAAYKVARDLYGLRSVVAHGAALDALIEQAAAPEPVHPCDVHFGARIVEVLAAAEESLRSGQRVRVDRQVSRG